MHNLTLLSRSFEKVALKSVTSATFKKKVTPESYTSMLSATTVLSLFV